MPTTYPNQRIVHIHRAALNKTEGFLSINNKSWKNAARVLKAPAFMLYIYLASNKDGYTLALSPAAILEEIGMARSTYNDQIKKLKAFGFLVQENDGWHFYEDPKTETRIQAVRVSVTENESKCPTADLSCTDAAKKCPQDSREINNNGEKNIKNSARVSSPLGEGFDF